MEKSYEQEESDLMDIKIKDSWNGSGIELLWDERYYKMEVS